MKNEISVGQYNSPKEIQKGRDCTIHAICTAIENLYNRNYPKERSLNLNEIEVGYHVSEYYGRHKTTILSQGGVINIKQSMECLRYGIPNNRDKIIKIKSIAEIKKESFEKTKKNIIECLNSGKPIIYAGKGSLKLVRQKKGTYKSTNFVQKNSGYHAMCLDTVNDAGVEFQNTFHMHIRTSMAWEEFMKAKCKMFKIDISVE